MFELLAPFLQSGFTEGRIGHAGLRGTARLGESPFPKREALAPGKHRRAGGKPDQVPKSFHGHPPERIGKSWRTVLTTPGSMSTPIIVGSMQTTSGMEISTGNRCAFSSARMRRFSRISAA